MNEYSPLLSVGRLSRLWWIVVLCTLAGGFASVIVSRIRQPVYEAKAVFHVSVDLNLVPDEQRPLELHDEDIALASIHGTLLSPSVIDYVLDEAGHQGFALTFEQLTKNHTVERRNTFWELRYRNEDPHTAQAIVNLWAEKGYQVAVSLQTEQKIPSYVLFNPPLLAGIPDQPVYYNFRQLVLAGGLIGLLVGILLAERVASRPVHP